MRVRATKLGYSGLERRRVGEVFEMDEDELYRKDKDGNIVKDKQGQPVLPSWVELVRSKTPAHETEDETDEETDQVPAPSKGKPKGKPQGGSKVKKSKVAEPPIEPKKPADSDVI